jgi:hypothetical protein
VELPTRNPPDTVLLRLRHPTAATIQSVTVNGTAWTRFTPDNEVVELPGLTGKVIVRAAYR